MLLYNNIGECPHGLGIRKCILNMTQEGLTIITINILMNIKIKILFIIKLIREGKGKLKYKENIFLIHKG